MRDLEQEKRKQTCLKKYGVENPAQLEQTKRKRRQTNLIKYGTEYAQQSIQIKEKIKHTVLKIHNARSKLTKDNIQEKRRLTNLKKYGSWHQQTVKARNNISETMTKVWSKRSPAKLKEIQENRKKTNLEKYGEEYAHQLEEIKVKTKLANLEKYGVEYTKQIHISRDSLKKLNNPDWLQEQHYELKKSLEQIAFELKVGATCVGRYFKKYSIKVKPYGFSHIAIQWLESIMVRDNIFIQHAQNVNEYKIPNTKLQVDGYCKETNTIYEFYGDFFHGNPKIYEANFYNGVLYKTAGELYQQTINRENQIKSLGYNLITLWESEQNSI
ncbi:MAG: DUF7487 domain-containing protein [Nitrosopumilaceae archaeon]